MSRAPKTRTARFSTLPAVGLLVLLFSFLVACSGADSPTSGATPENTSRPADAERIAVVTTTTFLADWAQEIGGDRVEVFSLVPVGSDPHGFQPGARDVARVAEADVVLSVGESLEGGWLRELVTNAAASESRVIEVADGLELMSFGEGEDHDEDADHDEDHDDEDADHDEDHDDEDADHDEDHDDEDADHDEDHDDEDADHDEDHDDEDADHDEDHDDEDADHDEDHDDEDADHDEDHDDEDADHDEDHDDEDADHDEDHDDEDADHDEDHDDEDADHDEDHDDEDADHDEDHDDEDADHDEDHDDEDADHDEHGHEGLDPHFWFDPILVQVVIDDIAEIFATIDPAGAADYQANATAYKAEIDELDAWIRAQTAAISEEDRLLVTSHDSLGYLARRYGFEVVGTVLGAGTADAEPSAEELAQLSDLVSEFGVRAVFGETTVTERLAASVAEESGARLVRLYSGSLGPEGSGADTWLGMMRVNIQRIVDGLSQGQ